MLLDDIFDRYQGCRGIHIDRSQDGEPRQDGPNTILLTDVVGTSSKGLFSTNERSVVLSIVNSFGIHQVSKILPSRGRLKEIKVQVLGNQIDGTGRRHGTSNTLQSSLSTEEGNDIGICGDNSQRIRWSHEELGSQNHVAVSISVGGSTEGGDLAITDINLESLLVQSHGCDKLLGVCQVGVSVSAIEVVLGNGVDTDGFRLSQFVAQDSLGVRAIHSVHAIVNHRKVLTTKECLESAKVEDGLQQRNMRFDSRNDFDAHFRRSIGARHCGHAWFGNIDSRKVACNLVRLDRLGVFKDGTRHLFWSGSSIFTIVLDTKVFFGTTGIV
mmetsp:Transcript_45712/g.67978  ORF Transcript_45712/g.67978 Transcript_45712/m.67978 type:complete len:327 (+) Transcript_45712:1214-2194(+)